MPTTRMISVDADQPDPAVLAEAAGIIRDGGLVAFATETVYGLGADATNPAAVARIFQAKGRPSTNPLIVHVESKAAALNCVSDWPARAEILADHFWPGPLTLVLPRSEVIPDLVTAGQGTVGVRVPRLTIARWLILESRRPIAAPSANRSNRISPTCADHVLQDLEGRVDLILDSGSTRVGIESTVLDLSIDHPRILRPGEITREQIAQVLGEPVERPQSQPDRDEPARSPGLRDVHYSPRTSAYRLDRDQTVTARTIEGAFGVLIFEGWGDEWCKLQFSSKPSWMHRLVGPESAAKRLYQTLHQLDDLELDFLLIVPPPDEPCWQAIRDRVWRATRPWPPG